MKFTTVATAAFALMAAPAFADGHASGNAEAGEDVFKKCKSCHMIVADDGTAIQKGGKTGPNLYNIAGATMGSVDGFRYSKLLEAGAEQGVVYTEEFFVKYVMDPTGASQEATGESGRGKMSFKVRKAEDAVNLYAYLASLSAGDS